jgi:16S rRNA (adenine1518-N6/adenine1519-N6)-dimethyltransferase
MSRTPLGQNFLADAGWRAQIGAELAARPGDLWIEIGAGHGEMTEFLAGHSARVVAIEIDAQLVAGLRKRAAYWPSVRVEEADVLTADLAKLAGAEKFRIYGNIPYYITSPILHRLFALNGAAKSAHLVMQLEVAERLVATPSHREYGYLSVATQFFAHAQILLKIPPSAFKPRPQVESALVAFYFPGAGAKENIGDTEAFLQFLHECFAMKRKTLANNLRGKRPKAEVPELLEKLDIPVTVRAEQLELAQFAAIYRELHEAKITP